MICELGGEFRDLDNLLPWGPLNVVTATSRCLALILLSTNLLTKRVFPLTETAYKRRLNEFPAGVMNRDNFGRPRGKGFHPRCAWASCRRGGFGKLSWTLFLWFPWFWPSQEISSRTLESFAWFWWHNLRWKITPARLGHPYHLRKPARWNDLQPLENREKETTCGKVAALD